jgi:hypothetical protein
LQYINFPSGSLHVVEKGYITALLGIKPLSSQNADRAIRSFDKNIKHVKTYVTALLLISGISEVLVLAKDWLS